MFKNCLSGNKYMCNNIISNFLKKKFALFFGKKAFDLYYSKKNWLHTP